MVLPRSEGGASQPGEAGTKAQKWALPGVLQNGEVLVRLERSEWGEYQKMRSTEQGGCSYMASQALVMIWAFIGCAMGSLCNVN